MKRRSSVLLLPLRIDIRLTPRTPHLPPPIPHYGAVGTQIEADAGAAVTELTGVNIRLGVIAFRAPAGLPHRPTGVATSGGGTPPQSLRSPRDCARL